MSQPRILTRANRGLWASIAALALGQAVALVAGVVGTRMAFASLDQGGLSQGAIALIAGAAVGLAGCRFALRLRSERLGQDYTAEVRKALLAQAMVTSPDRIATRRRGYLMLRLTGDMTTLKDGLARSLPPLLQACTLIPAAVAALFWVNPGFGLATVIVLGLSVAVIAVSVARLHRAHETLRHERAKLAADMAERMPIAPELARLGRRGRELSRLAKATTRLRQKSERRLIWVEGLRAMPGVLTGGVAVYVLVSGSRWGLPAGDLAAALGALGLLSLTLSDLSDALDRFLGGRVARAKLGKALPATQPVAADDDDRVRLGGRRVAVRLDCAAQIARPHQLDLLPGARGHLATDDPGLLLGCLTGLSSDHRVTVLLDDIPIGRLTPGTLRRSIGVISAQPALLKGSVRRNLCLGLSDRPADEALHKRVARAGLGGVLAQFGGLDGPVSEGGRSMSAKDRTSFSALQTAVQRPGWIIVAANTGDLSDETTAYLDRAQAIVLTVGRGGHGPDGRGGPAMI